MSEEKAGPESGPEGIAAGVDPVAAAIALGGASREEADAFLREQRALAADQRHHLHEQLKQIHLDMFEKWLGVALRLATLCVGLAAATAIGLMVWDAAHSKGLIVEPFNVPITLAQRGLGGPVLSNLLLDKLTLLQNQTQSGRPAQSYTNNWGADLRVEIPETGVSLGEIRRYLREWLGQDTHIVGDVWQTDNGIAIAARSSGGTAEVVSGRESDLDTLMQRVAENVYRVTQPYRYANYLDRDDFHPGITDYDAAEKIYRKLITDPNPVERAWAWNGLGNLAWTARHDAVGALDYYRRSYQTDPKFGNGYSANSYLYANFLGDPEAALKEGLVLDQLPGASPLSNIRTLPLLGDYMGLSRQSSARLERPESRTINSYDGARANLLWSLAAMHDGEAARAWERAMPPVSRPANAGTSAWLRVNADTALRDWSAVLKSEPKAEKAVLDFSPGWDTENLFKRTLRPMLAQAKAELGDVAGAEALIAASPTQCYGCWRVRARIALLKSDVSSADRWFTHATKAAPSIPFAYEEWGRSLLGRDKPDEAIAQFTLANQKGPHFADPLEGWGEALMAKNQSHLALEKFEEAEKYAPNWGRLHLKWGEALGYVGKKDEAQKQFARAAALDLTPPEQAELARMKHV